MRARWRLLVLLTVPAAAALATGAAADAHVDGGCLPPDVVLPRSTWSATPGDEEVLAVFVQNLNPAPATLHLNVTTPSGWSAGLETPRASMGPRTPEEANATRVRLALAAPQRGGGLSQGDVVVTARLTCLDAEGARSPPGTATLAVELVEPRTSALALGGTVVLAGAVLLGLWRVRRTRADLAFTPPDAVVVAPGGRERLHVHVENRASRAARVHLAPVNVPEGWTVFLPLDEVALEPGEVKELWVNVGAPDSAAPGREVVLHLRAGGARDRAAFRVPLVVHVGEMSNP